MPALSDAYVRVRVANPTTGTGGLLRRHSSCVDIYNEFAARAHNEIVHALQNDGHAFINCVERYSKACGVDQTDIQMQQRELTVAAAELVMVLSELAHHHPRYVVPSAVVQYAIGVHPDVESVVALRKN